MLQFIVSVECNKFLVSIIHKSVQKFWRKTSRTILAYK